MKLLAYKKRKQLARLTGNAYDTKEELQNLIEKVLYELTHHNKNYTKEQEYNLYILEEVYKIMTDKSNIEIE